PSPRTVASNRTSSCHFFAATSTGSSCGASRKGRTRRYDTAGGLAQDIQRYLSDEPVEARRPTRAYRLKKFGRRNRVGVIAGTTIVAALLGGLTLASVGFLQARAQ